MLLPTLRTLLDGGHFLVLLTTDLIRCALPPAPQQRSSSPHPRPSYACVVARLTPMTHFRMRACGRVEGTCMRARHQQLKQARTHARAHTRSHYHNHILFERHTQPRAPHPGTFLGSKFEPQRTGTVGPKCRGRGCKFSASTSC